MLAQEEKKETKITMSRPISRLPELCQVYSRLNWNFCTQLVFVGGFFFTKTLLRFACQEFLSYLLLHNQKLFFPNSSILEYSFLPCFARVTSVNKRSSQLSWSYFCLLVLKQNTAWRIGKKNIIHCLNQTSFHMHTKLWKGSLKFTFTTGSKPFWVPPFA